MNVLSFGITFTRWHCFPKQNLENVYELPASKHIFHNGISAEIFYISFAIFPSLTRFSIREYMFSA